jgi:hypothetical protein
MIQPPATPEALADEEEFEAKNRPGDLRVLAPVGGTDEPGAGAANEGVTESAPGSDAPKERPGLETVFSQGEQIPWKGLWFQIETVVHDRITLKPVGTTWKRYKQLKKERNEQ